MLPLMYIAGIFDADGCVTILRVKKQGRTMHRLQVEMSNCYAPLIRDFKKQFGGMVVCRSIVQRRARDNHEWGTRDTFSWITTCRSAGNFLTQIFPYMRVKRSETAVALRFQRRMSDGTRGHLVDSRELARRDHLADICSALKRRRYDLNGLSSHVDLGRKRVSLRG